MAPIDRAFFKGTMSESFPFLLLFSVLSYGWHDRENEYAARNMFTGPHVASPALMTIPGTTGKSWLIDLSADAILKANDGN